MSGGVRFGEEWCERGIREMKDDKHMMAFKTYLLSCLTELLFDAVNGPLSKGCDGGVPC